MKAKLPNGNLYLERRGIPIPQKCPFRPANEMQLCGDHCPLFEVTPRMVADRPEEPFNSPTHQEGFYLTLCHRTLTVTSIEGADTRPINWQPDTGFDA